MEIKNQRIYISTYMLYTYCHFKDKYTTNLQKKLHSWKRPRLWSRNWFFGRMGERDMGERLRNTLLAMADYKILALCYQGRLLVDMGEHSAWAMLYLSSEMPQSRAFRLQCPTHGRLIFRFRKWRDIKLIIKT